MDKIPRWRNLNHFNTVTKVTFTDGTKYEDMSKVRTPQLHYNIIYIFFRARLSYLRYITSLLVDADSYYFNAFEATLN